MTDSFTFPSLGGEVLRQSCSRCTSSGTTSKSLKRAALMFALGSTTVTDATRTFGAEGASPGLSRESVPWNVSFPDQRGPCTSDVTWSKSSQKLASWVSQKGAV